MADKYTMDRSQKKLRQIHDVSGWLIQHWNDMNWDLYEKRGEQFIPFDVREALSEILRCDLANILTVAENWRIMAAGDGVDVED